MANKRVHYFDHQFLREQDFTDEQNYHLGMRRLHNRVLHTWGIAEGLALSAAAGAARVTVSQGMAIDGQGRELTLDQDTQTQDLSGFAGKTVFLTLAYAEQQTDSTNETGVAGNTRWTEAPLIEANESAPGDPSQKLILGRVTVAGNGTVSGTDNGVEPNKRRSAGVVGGDLQVRSLTLTDPGVVSTQWPRMNLGAPNRADLQASLRVTGNIEASGTVDGRDVSADGAKLDAHAANTANPHSTTAAQVGALPLTGGTLTGSIQVNGNVGVTGTVDGRDVSADGAKLDAHVANTGNPHGTTAAQVGALPITGGAIDGPVTVTTTTGNSSVFMAGQPFNGVRGAVGGTFISSGFVSGVEGSALGGSSSGYGVAALSSTGNFALFVSGTARFTGAKTGYVVDSFINASGSQLRTGDIVKLKGTPITRFQGDGNKIPIPEVTLADKENDTMLIGIVDREAIPEQDVPDNRVGADDPNSIEDGGELFVVTLGTYAHCKADASETPIAVGDLLTTSANPGHAKKATDPKIGSIIGKALEPLKEGTGYISVFVNIQ